ncbi:MAG: HNH endonuclease signature motif containing protein [Flavobacterium sp.]
MFRPSRHIHKALKLHTIVWETFNGKIPEGYEIDHINNNRLDCRLDNLQLLTHADNVEKAWARNWKLKSPEGEHLSVYNLSKFCREQGLDQKSMSFVMSGKRNHHKGWTKL